MKRIFAACVLLSVATHSWSVPVPSTNNVFLAGGLGEMFARVADDNHLGTGPGWPTDHYVNRSMSNQPYFYFAAGYSWAMPSLWLPYYSLALRYTYVSTSSVSGYIDQYSLPQFRNYTYSYDVQLMTIMAVLKADLYRWHNLMPYVTAGVGPTNYSVSDYSEQPTSGVTPRVSPAFGSNSGNNFSYTLGAGLDYIVTENFWLNLEFNYNDYGTISTGRGANYNTLTATNFSTDSIKNTFSAASVFAGVTFYPG